MKKTISSVFVLLVLYGQVVFGQGLVRGTVRDEKGPFQGVSVLVKHAARGAQTDASGNFTIQSNRGDTLRFTYSGYASQESVVDGRNGYTIIINVDATQFKVAYDFKEFRYAEVLLILAEALYEKNGSISDADLNRTINLLRSRVNMPALTNNFVTSHSLNMRDELRRERTVELAFEGYRRDDLRRWNVAETFMPQAIRGVKFVGME